MYLFSQSKIIYENIIIYISKIYKVFFDIKQIKTSTCRIKSDTNVPSKSLYGLVSSIGISITQIIKKNETSLAGDIEEKILSMYAKGMTTNDISSHIEDIY